MTQRRKPPVVLSVMAVIIVLVFPMQLAHAETFEPTDEPGVMMVDGGSAIFADVLQGEMGETIIEQEMTVGDTLELVGKLGSGWGTVTFEWRHADGPLVLDLLTKGVGATYSIPWTTELEHTIQGQLPDINRAVVPGGQSQRCEIEAVSVGESAWCLYAYDGAGYSHCVCWVIHVVPDENGRTSLGTVGDDAIDGAVESVVASVAAKAMEAVADASYDNLTATATEALPEVENGTVTGDNLKATTSIMVITRLKKGDDPEPQPTPEPEPDPTPDPTPTPTPTPTPDNPTKPASSSSTPQPAASVTATNLPKTGDLAASTSMMAMSAAALFTCGLLLRWVSRRREAP